MRPSAVRSVAFALLPALWARAACRAQTSGVLQATVTVVDLRESEAGLRRVRALLGAPPPPDPTTPGRAPVHVAIEYPDRSRSDSAETALVRITLGYD